MLCNYLDLEDAQFASCKVCQADTEALCIVCSCTCAQKEGMLCAENSLRTKEHTNARDPSRPYQFDRYATLTSSLLALSLDGQPPLW